MPTGYTEAVQSGKVTEFPEFAMCCARAFGALIEMRDDPSDAEIPGHFKPSSYHSDRLMKARDELPLIESLSLTEIEQRAGAEYRENFSSWQKRGVDRGLEMSRYRNMLKSVRAWEPPTEDHVGLKEFMVKQLEDSIKFDCSFQFDNCPEKQEPSAWLATQIESIKRDIKYHKTHYAEEVARVESRNTWVKRLRESLNDKLQPASP